MDASFRQDGEIVEVVDASGTVLETLPELSEHAGKIVRYDYMMSSKRKVDVSAELSPEDAYEWLRCVTGVAGAAIVRGIGGAAAGGAGGSVLPGAGTLADAIGYGIGHRGRRCHRGRCVLAMSDGVRSVFSSKQAGIMMLCASMLAFVLFPIFAVPIFLTIGVLNAAGAIIFLSSARKQDEKSLPEVP